MKVGQKIKYDPGYTDFGKDVEETGYIVAIYDDYVWVADTKEDYEQGLGHSVPMRNIISR